MIYLFMIYFFIFLVLILLGLLFRSFTPAERARMWRQLRPAVFIAGAAAIAVIAVILIANGGGQFRVL